MNSNGRREWQDVPLTVRFLLIVGGALVTGGGIVVAITSAAQDLKQEVAVVREQIQSQGKQFELQIRSISANVAEIRERVEQMILQDIREGLRERTELRTRLDAIEKAIKQNK